MMNDQSTVFINHIREHAAQYYENLEAKQVQVKLDEKQERTASTLYQFTVGDDDQKRAILVKVPLYRGIPASDTKSVSSFKPRLYPRTEPRDMYWLEYQALSTIYNFFVNQNNKQFGAIRILDFIPEHRAIIMEESKDRSLLGLLLPTSLLYQHKASIDITKTFQNAGEWLRLYHALPKIENVVPRHSQRSDYCESVSTLTSYLSRTTGDVQFLKDIDLQIKNYAMQALPESLPLGLNHGDFSMRNILVGHHSRVTVIDTFAKWRTPIYEDIGYFLNELNTTKLQVFSQGLAYPAKQLLDYEKAFLTAYFDQKPIPYQAIRLFEILALIDKWATRLAMIQPKTTNRTFLKYLLSNFINRFYKRRILSLLQEMGAEF